MGVVRSDKPGNIFEQGIGRFFSGEFMISHDLFSVLLELVVTCDDRKIKLKNIVQMASRFRIVLGVKTGSSSNRNYSFNVFGMIAPSNSLCKCK